jgi:hydroxypyruvate reductase
MAAARAREQLTLTVSDVFRGFAGCVASGPSTAELDWQHGRRALDERQLWAAVPAALREPLRADTLPRGLRGPLPTPPTRFADVLDNRAAGLTMMAAARRAGLGPARFLDVDELDQDDQTAPGLAGRAVAALDRLRRRWPGRRVAVVTGGELSVPLPANPGIGGRNQQFVLECARLIRGRPITVLSGGTDGIDGNSTAAGGLADGHTMARARARGCDVHRALRDCDAFPLLQALGDTVVTGPTGTNVRDLRVLVHHD